MSGRFSVLPTSDKNERFIYCENLGENMKPPDVPLYLRKRYYVILLLFIGSILSTLLTVNLSICLVDITSSKLMTIRNTTYTKEAEFNLSLPQKGIILSSYSWGYSASPLGAIVSNKLGGVTVVGLTKIIVAILTILSPIIIHLDLHYLIFVRILEGFFQGLADSAIHAAFSKWIPPDERARLTNFALLGITAGAAISYPVIGFISYYLNWRFIFYISGGITIFWCLILFNTTSNTPLEDKFITKAEKEYFKGVNEYVAQKKVIIPWKSIFTSPAVLAYWNDRFVESWSTSFLLICLPLYVKDMYPSNIKDIGILSSVPFIFSIFSIIICSWILDHLRSRGVNKTKMHKSNILLGQVPAACILIIIGFCTNFQLAIIGFSVFKVCYCWANVSYHTLPQEMSPQHANFIVGIGGTIKSIGNIINPIVMGFMARNHLQQEWSQYFWFLSIFNFWGAVVFAIYGSGEVQPWANSNKFHQKPDDISDVVPN